MANNWGIPDWLEKEVRNRDKICVYCRVKMENKPKKNNLRRRATFEHIDNNGEPTAKNIAMCCNSCNASKGTKKLANWLQADYCKEKNINKKTVAPIIKKFIASN